MILKKKAKLDKTDGDEEMDGIEDNGCDQSSQDSSQATSSTDNRYCTIPKPNYYFIWESPM